MSFIARSEDQAGELYEWWEGEAIEEGDQLMCDVNEVAVFWDGENVVTTLGPGRHSLVAESKPELASFIQGEDGIYVCFVSTGNVRGFPVEGSFTDEDEEDEEVASVSLTLKVTDPSLFVAKAAEVEQGDEELGEPTAIEDWIAIQVLDAINEHIDAESSEISEELPGWVEEELAGGGVSVVRVEEIELPE